MSNPTALTNVCPVCDAPDNDHLDWCTPQARAKSALTSKERVTDGQLRQYREYVPLGALVGVGGKMLEQLLDEIDMLRSSLTEAQRSINFWMEAKDKAERSAAETECEPEEDPENAEIVAKLEAAFGGPPNERHLSRAMRKLADGAINVDNGIAILTHAECDAIGKEIRRLNRAARGESPLPHPYLCEATRFKLSFNRKGFTGALANFARDLDGRWVALVAAEDDCHMNGYLPVKSGDES